MPSAGADPVGVATTPGVVVELGTFLKSQGYAFITVTPLTHQRVLRNRLGHVAQDLRDAFGWNLPFHADGLLPTPLRETLLEQGWLELEQTLGESGAPLYRSQLRFGTLGADLYAHSAYPTTQEDAVFFGPDTYRFASLIAGELALRPLGAQARILDMGCGGAPGGIAARRAAAAGTSEVVLADINPCALTLARVNATLAGVQGVCSFVQSDLFKQVDGDFDLIVSNPPYLVDAGQRTYRHGGGAYGEGLSQRILDQSLQRLRPGGRLILYTGAAVVQGVDAFSDWALEAGTRSGFSVVRHEIDPDVFGEELDRDEYRGVDRIAAIGLVLQRPAP